LCSLASVGRATVAREPGGAGACDGGDRAGRIDAPDAVVRGIGDEHVAVVVERDAGRILEGRRGGRAAIARELGVAVAGDRRDRPVRGDPTDPVVERVGDEDVAVTIDRHPDRIVHLCVDRRTAVVRQRQALVPAAGDARTGNGGDRPVRDASHSVARVDDKDAPRRVGRDTGGPIELR
jgi:hypothetical protein